MFPPPIFITTKVPTPTRAIVMARKGIMLAYPYEPKRVKNWDTCFCQRKYNGHRCRSSVSEDGVIMLSSEANQIVSMPHIREDLERLLKDCGLSSIRFDGELYNHDLSRQQIQSLVNRKTPASDPTLIQYHIYDLWSHEVQSTRLDIIFSLFYNNKFQYLKPVPSLRLKVHTALEMCEHYVDEGYEGVILRHPYGLYEAKRSNYLIKYKPTETDLYVIDSVFEATDKYQNAKGMAGGLIVHDDEGNKFSVGMGKLNHASRYLLWQRWKDDPKSLIGHIAEVKYPEKSDGGIPVQSVLIKIQ